MLICSYSAKADWHYDVAAQDQRAIDIWGETTLFFFFLNENNIPLNADLIQAADVTDNV